MLNAGGGDSLRHSGDQSSMGKRGFELDVGAIAASASSVVVAALSARCRESADAVRRRLARPGLRPSTSLCGLEAVESEAATGP